ncbi:MAG: GIY-YIG nuclease family protein [Candidatus Omnitrophica bacterium]|nr:GIY-YIG nuclease family protein [Candidatus Omnitrophota bacterium]
MTQVYYAYILECNDGTKYYGHTNNLIERIKDHIGGRVCYTKNKQPELVYYEEFDSRSKAFECEMQFKNGKTRKKSIEKLITSFPKAKCQGFNSQTALRAYDLRRSLHSLRKSSAH